MFWISARKLLGEHRNLRCLHPGGFQNIDDAGIGDGLGDELADGELLLPLAHGRSWEKPLKGLRALPGRTRPLP
jgi:hypothetical protein